MMSAEKLKERETLLRSVAGQIALTPCADIADPLLRQEVRAALEERQDRLQA
jgi:hypothetical protein